ncbi:TonB-dependent receptor [Ramlibacter albus]|uniref:TonB-dependent siderophore receptor n=1 Tax=Ramlibacter albus TaxID=2079448 RepID=A0A923S392_9BURK|nr:TonB-dependent siderophore receptor [Ramlibacter albus]MBC5766176.1 TonB-dependent siderophore receptor [Ramlibacter albus]
MLNDKETSVFLPLGAMLLSASFGSWAQTTPAPTTLKPVIVRDKAEGRDSIRATDTHIGKGTQELRDIPQSITVITEKLIDDRNLDTMKDALKNSAGITFQAAEGGEEDIRLRGFSLATTGDIFLDGMRDPAFYDRDTFNNDRIEVLRGSASMLFGRGSTGGAVNQVSKLPRLLDGHEVTTTLGNHQYKRITGDFNWVTGENQALRVNAMATKADDNGTGASIDKRGLALAYRWGIGTRNEFLVNGYYLDNDNGLNYGLPWIRPTAASTSGGNTPIPGLAPTTNYGLSSDRNDGGARFLAFSHVHRFDGGSELKTQVRKGAFERDLRAGAVRFVDTNTSLANLGAATQLRRGNNFKIQDVDTLHAQSDLSAKFEAAGFRHELQTGIDAAREEKVVYIPRSAAQGGVDLTKPLTTIGMPGPNGWVDESRRLLRTNNQFTNKAWGVYAQDLVQVAPHWKLLGGLRYDSMDGRYDQFNIPANAPGPLSTVSYEQKISEVSKRAGVLYQPDDHRSFHFSWGTSFNTSGDSYSYNAQSANTPPEQSENLELGAKLDSQDKRFSYRFALFHSTKKNERNTDPDTAATRLLLSGKRHSAGFEFDISGRITPQWEVYGSYMWMPIARVDEAASTATTVGNRVGDRPGLSPRHSGTFWTTYQFTPKWRAGAGVNFRSPQAPADVTAPAWEAPGFATVDLMAEYNINDTFAVKGNVSNLADKYYADALYRGHYVPGAGRLVQVSLTARF